MNISGHLISQSPSFQKVLVYCIVVWSVAVLAVMYFHKIISSINQISKSYAYVVYTVTKLNTAVITHSSTLSVCTPEAAE
jgi:hypothetical protein